MARTTSELLTSIREQGRIPESDPEATDAKLLLEADRQMELVFVPATRKARQEWYLTWQDQALVANQAAYSIPYRAISASVKEVVWLPTLDGQEIPLAPVPVSKQHQFKPSTGQPCYYCVQDDRLVLLPTPAASQGYLRVFYERAPGTLVATSACAQVTSVVSSSSTSLVLATSGATFTTGQVLDVVSYRAPYSLKCESLTATVAGNVTLARLNDSRVPAVGDWLALEETSPIPQLPDELHPLLAMAVAAAWVFRVDQQAGVALKAELGQGLSDALSLISTRQLGRKIKIKSEHSMMRSRGGRRSHWSDWTP